MLSDEEIDELAKDIKANGLKHPIVFQDTGGKEEDHSRSSATALDRAEFAADQQVASWTHIELCA
jgi:hypothetical protein